VFLLIEQFHGHSSTDFLVSYNHGLVADVRYTVIVIASGLLVYYAWDTHRLLDPRATSDVDLVGLATKTTFLVTSLL
jgi:hypothetical protein